MCYTKINAKKSTAKDVQLLTYTVFSYCYNLCNVLNHKYNAIKIVSRTNVTIISGNRP